MTQVNITVLKRTLFPDIADAYRIKAKELCELFTEGQEFIAEETFLYGPLLASAPLPGTTFTNSLWPSSTAVLFRWI